MPTGTLPESGKKLWEEVHSKALKGSCKDEKDPEACAAGSAWKAVKNAGWSKDADGKWSRKAELEELSLTIKKISTDPKTGERRWRADTSNIFDDQAGDNMTQELFASFMERINSDAVAPEEFRTSFWQGGMPYLSISHYPDLDGDAVPGPVDATYVDGAYLKAKGRFFSNKLGDACWSSISKDFEMVKRGEEVPNKVRVSIGFLDFRHIHKRNGYEFVRTDDTPYCKECIAERFLGESAVGRSFVDGMLVHFAMTRVPMNRDTDFSPDVEVDRSMTTRKEDAASIVGEELAGDLDEKAKLVGKSDALIIKAADTCPECGKKMVDGKCPECDAESAEEDKKCGKDKKKSEVEEVSELAEVTKSITELSTRIDAVLLSLTEKSDPEPVAEHPRYAELDKSLVSLMSFYGDIVKSDIPVDDKLRSIQEPFNAFGQAVIDGIKSHQKEEVSTPETDLVKAFSAALQPLTQKLDMLITSQQDRPVQQVPMRRSISAAEAIPQINANAAKPGSLDALIRKSVGLST